ncbi:MAG: sigma-54-dependent transcriptional regulator [Burkholderiales bacterium]
MEDEKKPDLLIVDDDPLITDTLQFVLSRDFNVFCAESRPQVKSLLRQLDSPPELALIDLGLPPKPHQPDEGFQLITELLAHSPRIKIVVLSGQSDESNAKHARTLGAIEFVAKPCEPERLKELLHSARNIATAERTAEKQHKGDGLVGKGPAVEKLRQQIRQYASSPFSVLIEGESGSGKELVAVSLHNQSPRASKPYLTLNCAAMAPNLMEAALFGHARGAFTGATVQRAGFFEDTKDGTLFLDEIGELPLDSQAKLLRVLENGEYQRVGETQNRFSQARVIAATNRDLRQEAKAGRFRVDLYHRLSVFTINVPPLREMGEDRRLLAEFFCSFYAKQSGLAPFDFDAGATDLWMRYDFPGNVRELRNIVIRLSTKYPGQRVNAEQLQAELDPDAFTSESSGLVLPREAGAALESAKTYLQAHKDFSLDALLQHWEKTFIDAAMALSNGNLSQAARILGVHRTTLYSRMQTFGGGAAASGGEPQS